ncbi:XdhC family protein, partial [Luminiphilus sp.]|nr:XdhC family protein [Luminiphilus sp.]
MQLANMLTQWRVNRDSHEWVLGTVYKTEGSSYRKPGAMSLIGSGGQQLGLLSGGCLEADIRLNARKVMATGVPSSIRYDGDDEDDLAFRLGIGCGGVVYVLLEPVSRENNYQGLSDIHDALTKRQSGLFKQHIPKAGQSSRSAEFILNSALVRHRARSRLEQVEDETWLVSSVTPTPHLLVAG